MNEIKQPGSVECWCLHGAVGATGDWRGLAAAMEPRGISVRGFDLWKILQCRGVDLPGAGGIVNRECAALGGPGKRILVGYSLGGRLALHSLLGDGGGMWDAAVIVSAHPGLEEDDERAKRRETDALWATRALQGDWREFLRDWEAQPVLRGAEHQSDDLADRGALVARRNEIARSFVCWSLGAQMPLWERLAEIRCPVLWMAGGRDGKFRAIAERAVEKLPNARIWIAPGAGHRVPWEAAGEFAERMADFADGDT
jgi:2-succinyl-6-hydroxy-2,4-cyclohexadiene-1-carboxylate synthase